MKALYLKVEYHQRWQLKKGDKSKAFASYKRALEIDPNFPNATAAKEIVSKLSNELSTQ